MSAALPDELGPSFERLDRAVTEVVGSDLDPLDERTLIVRIDRFHRSAARLAAERARIAAELERRRTRTIDDPGARDRARQRLRRDLAGRSNVTQSATKLDAQAGLAATCYPSTGAAFAAGEIGAEHVRLIAETLDAITDDDQREAAEQQLLSTARCANPTILGRHARDLLARQAPLAAEAAERRRHESRRMTTYDTPDGGFAFSGLLYGTAAETARVAMDAFRTPDAPDEHRTPGQRGADAFEQLCTNALRGGDASAQHGVRPHVLITVTTDQLELGGSGVARLGSGQPFTLDQLRHLLHDCSWARVVLAPNGAPIEASGSVRTVPSGLWRALLARDSGCTWPGCEAPASWCDVAHGRIPFARGGRLTPDNATLLCRRHHRQVDREGYRIIIEGDRVRFEPPERIEAVVSTAPTTEVGAASEPAPARDTVEIRSSPMPHRSRTPRGSTPPAASTSPRRGPSTPTATSPRRSSPDPSCTPAPRATSLPGKASSRRSGTATPSHQASLLAHEEDP
jgi:hypothetical protein